MGQSNSRDLYENDDYDSIISQSSMEMEEKKEPLPKYSADNRSISSTAPPPTKFAVEKSNRKCSCCITFFVFIVLLIAGGAAGLSVYNFLELMRQKTESDSDVANIAMQTQDYMYVKTNLSGRVQELEMLLKEANTKLKQMTATLEQYNDSITALNSSRIVGLQSKVDSLDGKLNSTVSSIRELDMNLRVNVSSLKISINETTENITTQITFLLSNLTTISTDVNTTRNGISSLTTRTTALETNYASLSTIQNTTRSDVSTLQSTLSSLATQLNTLSSSVSRLNTSTRATAYTHCRKDVTTCDIVRHPTNQYWFRCTTAYSAVNVSGYYTLSTQCQRDPDEIYIDSAYLEINNGFVRCHCDIVGITAGGSHAGIFDPLPTGNCSMVITRCPMLPTPAT